MLSRLLGMGELGDPPGEAVGGVCGSAALPCSRHDPATPTAACAILAMQQPLCGLCRVGLNGLTGMLAQCMQHLAGCPSWHWHALWASFCCLSSTSSTRLAVRSVSNSFQWHQHCLISALHVTGLHQPMGKAVSLNGSQLHPWRPQASRLSPAPRDSLTPGLALEVPEAGKGWPPSHSRWGSRTRGSPRLQAGAGAGAGAGGVGAAARGCGCSEGPGPRRRAAPAPHRAGHTAHWSWGSWVQALGGSRCSGAPAGRRGCHWLCRTWARPHGTLACTAAHWSKLRRSWACCTDCR